MFSNILKTILFFIIVINLEAGVAKGQLLYKKKLRAGCGLSVAQMSHKHTMKEWRYLYKNNLLTLEISRICPDVKPIIKKRSLKNLYDLFRTFANDSGNTPAQD